MRLIDADALLPMMKYATIDNEIGVFPIKIGFNAIAKVINETPTVDAVPVIRCKDCKHWSKPHGWNGFCEHGIPAEADDFCGWAERKDNG